MELRVEPGTLIASFPDMVDPNFMHSVVLVCEHDERGAFGLVLNQPTELTTDVLLADHPQLGQVAYPVDRGGPVGENQLQILHRVPDEVPGGLPLTKSLHLGGELDALGAFAASRGPAGVSELRLFLGYSGWGPGQLDDELQRGSWVPVPLAPEELFDARGETAWRAAVRSVRELRGWEHLPPDPTWN